MKMDRFRTAITAHPAPFSIGHSDRLMLAGSCFTEHIGTWLGAHKFPVRINPFGIVYNPASITRCLDRLRAGDRPFEHGELFENAGLWRSWEHHSDFADPAPDSALERINKAYTADSDWLHHTNRLLLTFGTADVFTRKDTGRVVANNHKMPAAGFEKRRLSVQEIADETCGVLDKIRLEQPDLQIILTISPVRHLREGAIASQRSKATLVLACEEICRRLPFVHYFPAYELLLDDLRDYRFYAADMIHPSETAVEYIREQFAETYFSPETRRLAARIEKVRQAMLHRPFHPDTPEHRAFKKAQLEAVQQLKKEYPALDWEEEEVFFQD